jgi:hypothetical protein
MSTTNKAKRAYSSPLIERVQLDNEISLALESTTPPEGPNGTEGYAPEYLHNDPFKINLG